MCIVAITLSQDQKFVTKCTTENDLFEGKSRRNSNQCRAEKGMEEDQRSVKQRPSLDSGLKEQTLGGLLYDRNPTCSWVS